MVRIPGRQTPKSMELQRIRTQLSDFYSLIHSVLYSLIFPPLIHLNLQYCAFYSMLQTSKFILVSEAMMLGILVPYELIFHLSTVTFFIPILLN